MFWLLGLEGVLALDVWIRVHHVSLLVEMEDSGVMKGHTRRSILDVDASLDEEARLAG